MIYVIMWNFVSVGGSFTRIDFQSECYGNCNKSTVFVFCTLAAAVFWLKCKCKFAHETDGSCNATTRKVSGCRERKRGKSSPNAITFLSTSTRLAFITAGEIWLHPFRSPTLCIMLILINLMKTTFFLTRKRLLLWSRWTTCHVIKRQRMVIGKNAMGWW